MTITDLDYALNCAAVEIDTTNARFEAAVLRLKAATLASAISLIIDIWAMANNGTSSVEIEPSSPLWQIEADTRTWLTQQGYWNE
jgi:hypothetical protein